MTHGALTEKQTGSSAQNSGELVWPFLQASEAPSLGEAAGVARRVWSDVESNELLLYMRRLEPGLWDALSRPRSGAVDAAFDGLVNVLLGSLVRCSPAFGNKFLDVLALLAASIFRGVLMPICVTVLSQCRRTQRP